MTGLGSTRRSGRTVAGAATVALLAAASGLIGGPARAATTKPAAQPALADGQLVVKLAPGADVAVLNRQLGSQTASTLLASRSIYLLAVPVREHDSAKPGEVWKAQSAQIVKALAHDPTVVFAEPNLATQAPEADRLHLWPDGPPTCLGDDPGLFTDQPAVQDFRLTEVHRIATGAGAVVAVLDSGVDGEHAALRGRLDPGYDYIDDDPVPDDTGDGPGVGHGTFVAGIVSLVAPGARIRPERVLDPQGIGNAFVVAEAIFDAVGAGVDVINLSFGTTDKRESEIMKDALAAAQKAGVIVVGAAGNDGSTAQHYPAASAGVISVAATDVAESSLATFSARGGWVDLAAPGVDIVSTLPCGYGRWSGTSMAAPFVSGEAALLRQRLANGKSADVTHRLTQGVLKLRGNGVHSGAIDIYRAVTQR